VGEMDQEEADDLGIERAQVAMAADAGDDL
jgi:uncharacterized protein YjiS (DUF1127 family)